MLFNGRTTVLGGEGDIYGAGLGHDIILAAVLVTKRVSSNNDWLSPSWHAARDILHDDWLSEDSSVKDVSNGTVRAPPHLLEVELFNSALVGSDRRALDGHLVLLGGIGCVDCNMVVGGVARSH